MPFDNFQGWIVVTETRFTEFPTDPRVLETIKYLIRQAFALLIQIVMGGLIQD